MHEQFINYGTATEKLAEECCELAQVCMKIQRFGLDDWNPLKTEIVTNRQRLNEEIEDVELAIINVKKWVATITKPQRIRMEREQCSQSKGGSGVHS